MGSDAPPSYSGASAEAGAPPEYDSLFGKIKETKSSSSGMPDFFKKLAHLLCSTIGCTIAAILLLGIPIAMIVIGAKYKDDCHVQRLIPIYLIVAGSFGIVRNLCCARKGMKDDDSDEAADDNAKDKGGIIDIFLFAWLICGSVWVYRIYGDIDYTDRTAPNFCHETVYKFAFGIITASWSLVGLVFLCCCCVGVCAGVME